MWDDSLAGLFASGRSLGMPMENTSHHGSADVKKSERMERLSSHNNVQQKGIAGYTKFVRILRLALLLVVIALVAVLFARTGVQDTIVVPVEDVEQAMPDHPRIARNELLNPHFESADKKDQPYHITADRAVQGEVNKDLIMLERPIGVMTMKNGGMIKVRSHSGAYRQDTERFFLQGGVFLDNQDGYTLTTEEAHIDLQKKFAWSEMDVQGAGPDISINAKGVRADAQTGEIIFVGPAKLVLKEGFSGEGQ